MATPRTEKLKDVSQLGEVFLRGLDELECEFGGMTAKQAIQRSIKDSLESFAVYDPEGELVLVFGYMPQGFIGEVVRVWLLTTPDINKYIFQFARTYRDVVTVLLQHYPVVEAYVWRGHSVALKWLRKIGFTDYKENGAFVFMRKER